MGLAKSKHVRLDTMYDDPTYKCMTVLQEHPSMAYSYLGTKYALKLAQFDNNEPEKIKQDKIKDKKDLELFQKLSKIEGLVISSVLWINEKHARSLILPSQYGEIHSLPFYNAENFGIVDVINKKSTTISGRKMNRLQTVDDGDNMVLVSVFKFNNVWKYRFNKQDNKISRFYCDDRNIIRCEYMRQVANHQFYDLLDRTVVCMPFINGCEFVVIVPRYIYKPFGLSSDVILEYVNNTKEEQIYIEMPRINRDLDMNMIKVMQDLGNEFTLGQHEGMKDTPINNLFLTKFEHQCKVNINEAGVYSTIQTQEEREEVYCNRAFTYAIVHRKLQQVLMIGTYEKPKK